MPGQRLVQHRLDAKVSRGFLSNSTLESGIDVGQKINVRPGKLGKNNKRMALNKCSA